MVVDHSEAHIRLNRLLDGTTCGATTEERTSVDLLHYCGVTVTRWPRMGQILMAPKIVYKANHSTWEEAYDACVAWVEAELASVQ